MPLSESAAPTHGVRRHEEGARFEGFSLHFAVPSEAEAERVFTALAREVKWECARQTFWASKFGMLTDRLELVGW